MQRTEHAHVSMFGGYTRMRFSNFALEFFTKFKLNEIQQMIPHETIFHAKQSSTQTYLFSFFIIVPLRRGEAEHTVSTHTLFNMKGDATWIYNFPCEAVLSWVYT